MKKKLTKAELEKLVERQKKHIKKLKCELMKHKFPQRYSDHHVIRNTVPSDFGFSYLDRDLGPDRLDVEDSGLTTRWGEK